ncbi:MAG: DUF2804 domain-containing protein [Ruthenibacterium sp.]|jgi:hypothetical protein
MHQQEIKTPGYVLDSRGVIQPGWAPRAVQTYRRADIKASPLRIKEWDFYQVSDREKCLQFTFGHASYAGQAGIMLFDFKKGEMIADISKLIPFPFGSLHLPENAEEDSDVTYDKQGVHLRFKTEGETRFLSFSAPDFEATITLERTMPFSTVIQTPFKESPRMFYYNQKINCMTARGRAVYKGRTYTFGEDAFGLLDWGRGVWPYHNEWYWSNGTGPVAGQLFGFNLGRGFGDTSKATENMLFYGGEVTKLGQVHFDLGTAYMKPWHLYDDEGKLDLTLTPSFDRTTRIKALVVNNCCHQMFGMFEGAAVLADGTRLQIEELPAFAEHAVNNW